MTTRTWKRLKASPDGLAYFSCPEEPGRIYVADHSGATPDSAEDGPQRLVGPLSADWKNVSAGVLNDRGSASTTLLGFDEALWVAMYFGFPIETQYGRYNSITPEKLEELRQR
jgi:hypothetical protein